jgi:hypothetical protein
MFRASFGPNENVLDPSRISTDGNTNFVAVNVSTKEVERIVIASEIGEETIDIIVLSTDLF